MKYFLTAILTVLVGSPWLAADSSAASRGSYRGKGYHGRVGSGWHRTHALPSGKRVMIPMGGGVMIPMGGGVRKKAGRRGIHFQKRKPQKILGWPYTRHISRGKHKRRSPHLHGRRTRHGRGKPFPGRLGFRRSRFFYSYAPIYYPPGAYVTSVNPYPYDYVILDGIVKGEVGGRMGEQDQIQMAENTHAALETAPEGAVTEWHNPDSDIIGTVSPISSFRSEQNERCREFQQTVTFDGVTEVAYGTACRQENGGWKIASY